MARPKKTTLRISQEKTPRSSIQSTTSSNDELEVMRKNLEQTNKQLEELKSQLSGGVAQTVKEEIKKAAPLFGVSGLTPNDRERHQSKKDIMLKKLQADKKVAVFVPLSKGEKAGDAVFPVTLDGCFWPVVKGVYQEVPKQVADVVMNSLNQTEAALNNEFRIDGSDDKRSALG